MKISHDSFFLQNILTQNALIDCIPCEICARNKFTASSATNLLSSLLLKSIDQRQPDDLGWLASVCKLTSLVVLDAFLNDLLNSINYYLKFKLINRIDEHQTKLFSLQTLASQPISPG